MADEPGNFGAHRIARARMISMPQVNGGKVEFFGSPPGEEELRESLSDGPRGTLGAQTRGMKRALQDTVGARKRARRDPPAAGAAVSSIGVMDVGQGNCNLLFEGTEPLAYFDIGSPLTFYLASAPPQIFKAAHGPITHKTGPGELRVVLSHWDWDHWRLAAHFNQLREVPWMIPAQPAGPLALNFREELRTVEEVGAPDPAEMTNRAAGGPINMPQAGFTVHHCWPPAGSSPAMVMNNSGLAISVPIRLPAADPAEHKMLLTGDANFTSLPLLATLPNPPITGITAVHHGSRSHGASTGLVPPAAAIAGAGRIAYSSGRFPNGWHPYNFPHPEAVTNYRNAGWTDEVSTAEGDRINAVPPAAPGPRGNIRFGDQTALPDCYAPTAFADFPNHLT